MSDLAQRDRPFRSTKVLRSAKGRPCAARFPGICNSNPETTVWAHLNGHAFGKGMAVKAHDILGFHACSSCHAYLDFGHGTKPILTNEELLQCVLRGVTETWVRLVRDGIVIVQQDAETSSHDKPSKPRKPSKQRAKIAARPFADEHRPLRSGNSFQRSASNSRDINEDRT